MPKLNAFQLKILAIIGMVLNHMVLAWWPIMPTWLAVTFYVAGGLTFPILAFFVVEGYKHTSNLKRYMLRILVFGIIAAAFHPFVFEAIILNIMFTIFVGLICLVMYDRMKNRVLFWILFVIICLLTSFPVPFDWGTVGIIMILLFHTMRNEKVRRIIPVVIGGTVMFFGSLIGVLGAWFLQFLDLPEAEYADLTLMLVSLSFIIGCAFAALLLKNYNGERGKRMKWLFYIVYPLHLAILGGVALLLNFVDFSVFNFTFLEMWRGLMQ